jgi:anti-anti-sigma factor
MGSTCLPAGCGEPVTVTFPDEIDIANVGQASSALAAALDGSSDVVIADLTGTRFFGADGANLLVATHRQAVAAGRELRIAASPPVRRILTLTRLDQMLAVYPDLGAARAGGRPGPPRDLPARPAVLRDPAAPPGPQLAWRRPVREPLPAPGS